MHTVNLPRANNWGASDLCRASTRAHSATPRPCVHCGALLQAFELLHAGECLRCVLTFD